MPRLFGKPARAKFIRVEVGGNLHLFELKQAKPGSIDIDKPAVCPVCGVPLLVVLDITQYGFFEDKFIVLFVSLDCGTAYWYSYSVGSLELTDNGAQVMELEHHD